MQYICSFKLHNRRDKRGIGQLVEIDQPMRA